ncbi:hypothetical protein BH24ACT18_BH24ACT18_09770 [soil metagenome]
MYLAGLLHGRIAPGPDPGRFAVTVIRGIAGVPVGGDGLQPFGQTFPRYGV